MKNIEVSTLVKRNTFFAAFTLLALILASGSLSRALAQGSGDRAIDQAQRAVRERITSREGGRNPTVVFNSDTKTEFIWNRGVRIRGTGTFSRNNDPRYNNDQRYNYGESRNFSYEAIVNNRNRDRYSDNKVSGIRYDWRDGWYGNGRDNDRYGDGDYRAQSIYCASDDGRRRTYLVNTGGVVRLVNQRSESACVEGRTWGFNRNSVWVDRGCRADFEIGRGRDDGAYGRGNDSSYGSDARPDGRVSYSGPIMNRRSDKALDVTGQSTQDGANIRQWGYADQANQNWDVIDLGAGEVAIISRHSGKAITVQGGRDDNGANIIQRSWNGAPQQRWRLEQVGGDYYRIVSVDNGKCLDVREQGKQDGAGVQLWAYANQANQQWRLRR
ncbi:MAG TPA: RICIN domain-containing protein [Blastocatellia bacterium]|nr:RICIN domain-containing protein [Blastocatellia bacterium]